MTGSFRERMRIAREHESLVLASIRKRDWWVACEYGQGMLTEEVRNHLRHIDTPLRWQADIVAVRTDRPAAYMVDAKASDRRDTPNYDIEQSALMVSHNWYTHMRLPLVIVWYDGGCNFTWDLLAADAPLVPMSGVGPQRTDFFLWPKAQARPFDSVFGEDAELFGPPPEWRMRDIRRGAA
jgi:hypothetical protein